MYVCLYTLTFSTATARRWFLSLVVFVSLTIDLVIYSITCVHLRRPREGGEGKVFPSLPLPVNTIRTYIHRYTEQSEKRKESGTYICMYVYRLILCSPKKGSALRNLSTHLGPLSWAIFSLSAFLRWAMGDPLLGGGCVQPLELFVDCRRRF